MKLFKASLYPFQILKSDMGKFTEPRPLIRDDNGKMHMWCVSPVHGRSFVMGIYPDGKWIISKGNGLSYSVYNFVNTGKDWQQAWGMLHEKNAIRDFLIGKEIQSLGIKTNTMEYVLKINNRTRHDFPENTYSPCLLQYTVECPYRICDYAFMPQDDFKREIARWQQMNKRNFDKHHLIAANVLINNLRIMHDHHIMHNAIHVQNYTWALELLDFESSRTPGNPYDSLEYEKHVPQLMEGEVIQTYEVINYIAWCLGEKMDNPCVNNLFMEYDFKLKSIV